MQKQKKQEAEEPRTKVNDAIIDYVSLNTTLYYLIILTIMNND